MGHAKNHTSSRDWLEGIFVFIVTLMPLAVAIRYKWGENILPCAMLALLLLLLASPGARTAFMEEAAGVFRGPVGLVGFAAVLWLVISLSWAVDFRLSAIGTAKAIGVIGAAVAIAVALKSISSARIFPPLIGFTVASAFIVILTSWSGGRVHALFNCCEGGMQPHLSGGAVAIALFLWPCVGWLVIRGHRRAPILLIALACIVVAFSKSGAAWLALLAGAATVVIGRHSPRMAISLPLACAFLGLLTAPFLSTLTALLDETGLLGRMSAVHASERAQIWTYYTELFWQRPWTGFGFRAEEIVGDVSRAKEFTQALPPPYAGFHAHNVSLQIQFQFGIVGAALVLALAAAATWRLYAMPVTEAAAFSVAPAVAAAAAAHVNFSIWEWWWLAVILVPIVFSGRLLQADVSRDDVRPISSAPCGSAAG